MLNRRRALTLGGVLLSGAVLAADQELASARPAVNPMGHDMAGMRGMARTPGPAPKITPFAVRMPVPPELTPVESRHDVDIYRQTIQPLREEMLPGLRTPIYSYGSGFVGPTIRAREGRPVIVTRTNRLGVPANAHLHGGHVPADSDGHPMDAISPGGSRVYHYPNTQPGATLWYHDHVHMSEAEGVYRGLHGFYLLESDDERRLGLPSGRYDVPILLTDAHFDVTGTMIYAPEDTPNRTTLLANGRPQPYFPVAARKYRFRLLNASNYRTFQLSLDGKAVTQIGSDGGLLPEPLSRTELVMSPGERVEIVVDFARYPIGTRLVLSDVSGPVLRFDVRSHAEDHSRVPDTLRPLPPLVGGPTTREFTLNVDMVKGASYINGRSYDHNRIDTRVRRNTTEIWRVTNLDAAIGLSHNMHLHLVQFRVLDRDGAPPLPGESGLKDTVLVPPGKSVRVKVTFGDLLGVYLYHCHMLEHSAIGGMMAQMEVTV